jgi:hypothetical protein
MALHVLSPSKSGMAGALQTLRCAPPIREIMSPDAMAGFWVGFACGVVVVLLVDLLRKWTRRG